MVDNSSGNLTLEPIKNEEIGRKKERLQANARTTDVLVLGSQKERQTHV